MKKRIAVIANVGRINDRKGQFNAIINRTKHLIALEKNYLIDVYFICSYEPWHVRKLRNTDKVEKIKSIDVDSIKINIIWVRYFVIDYILKAKFNKKAIFESLSLSFVHKKLKDYDFVIAHSTDGGEIALKAKQKWGIPFSVTWHGSDIHTTPFHNPSCYKTTKKIIENTDVNFFVSEALLLLSNKISEKGRKDTLYNGADKIFYTYPIKERYNLKEQYNVEDKKVVTFAGNFITVKNVLIIPEIFRHIHNKDKNVQFWMIGDGKLRKEVERRSKDLPVIFWGNRSPEEIPKFLNCTSVQILPSKNEGLPLTMVEALRCGCHAVGSLTGGIPEVIGKDNCISPDDPSFTEKIASRVLFFLNEGKDEEQILPTQFNWDITAKKEFGITNSIICENSRKTTS